MPGGGGVRREGRLRRAVNTTPKSAPLAYHGNLSLSHTAAMTSPIMR